MSGENGDFKEHRLLILDALKRHEDQQSEDRKENRRSHDEIMKKIGKLEISNAKQGAWGGVGGVVVVGAKMIFDKMMGN